MTTDDSNSSSNMAAAAAVAWLKQPRSERLQYPLNMTVDFTKLRANALRRYMAFHGIQEIPGSSKEQLAVVVARHFHDECKLTDEETSIASFLTYIKGARAASSDPEQDDEYEQRRGDVYGTDDAHTPDPIHHDTIHDHWDHKGSSSPSQDDDGDDDNEDFTKPSSAAKRSRSHDASFSSPSSRKHHANRTTKSSSTSSSSHKSNKSNTNTSSAKKRKTRLYCVCKGDSFGNMIACDNRKCLDHSNWYHMACVDLDPSEEPPETWFCPACAERDADELPEHQYRKPVASVTYGDMISHAITALPQKKGSFKDICDFVEKQYESQLNWKLESDQRKSPVWKSSVRKILFSNGRFCKHPEDKTVFTLAA